MSLSKMPEGLRPTQVTALPERTWAERQEELEGRLSRSKRMVATGRYHWIEIHRPELVVAAVHEIVNDPTLGNMILAHFDFKPVHR